MNSTPERHAADSHCKLKWKHFVLPVFLLLSPFFTQTYAAARNDTPVSITQTRNSTVSNQKLYSIPEFTPFVTIQKQLEPEPEIELWAKETSDNYGRPENALNFELAQLGPSKMNFFGRYEPLAEASADVSMVIVGTIVVLYFSPESISKWSDDEKNMSKALDNWHEHVQEGPVIDNDELWINYIGHPYFGAGYYNHAQHMGYNRLDSLLFAIVMSTCFYEYGFEALFEVPSAQDLYVTPLFGAIWGEAFLAVERHIKKNKNTVLGSRKLGATCRALLDPIGFPVKAINNMNKKWVKIKMEANYFTECLITHYDLTGDEIGKDMRYGFRVSIYRK